MSIQKDRSANASHKSDIGSSKSSPTVIKWFSNLLERSQFNRRLRNLGDAIENLRRIWVKQLGVEDANSFMLLPFLSRSSRRDATPKFCFYYFLISESNRIGIFSNKIGKSNRKSRTYANLACYQNSSAVQIYRSFNNG